LKKIPKTKPITEHDAETTTPINAPLLRPAIFLSVFELLEVLALGGVVEEVLEESEDCVCLAIADVGREVAAATRLVSES
jgi:hypothetical protein